MSFSTFARKVRDPALPYGRRVSALRSCVQLYRPIGFEATLSFLRAKAGPFTTDETALLRALTILEASRAAWTAEKQTYGTHRSRAKQQGARSPRPTDTNPYVLTHWYGARQEAALHAVDFWYRRRLAKLITEGDQTSQDLRQCVQMALASGGSPDPVQRRSLARCKDELTARLRPTLWRDDPADYYRTRDLLIVAQHLEVALSPP